MNNTRIPLLKFKCNNKHCQFECFINQHNNVLTAYSSDFSAMLDWTCPECKEGQLRYAVKNTQFIFSLHKESKGPGDEMCGS